MSCLDLIRVLKQKYKPSWNIDEIEYAADTDMVEVRGAKIGCVQKTCERIVRGTHEGHTTGRPRHNHFRPRTEITGSLAPKKTLIAYVKYFYFLKFGCCYTY